jgi:hypothetical protein
VIILGAPLQIYPIGPGFSYVIHPDHRNGNHNKSQWTISEVNELNVFVGTYQQSWFANTVGWGIFVVDGNIRYLGVGQDHLERVFIAKFVTNHSQQPWHGYPADHRNNQADIPDRDILRRWLQGNVLPAPKISKILGGKKCRL